MVLVHAPPLNFIFFSTRPVCHTFSSLKLHTRHKTDTVQYTLRTFLRVQSIINLGLQKQINTRPCVRYTNWEASSSSVVTNMAPKISIRILLIIQDRFRNTYLFIFSYRNRIKQKLILRNNRKKICHQYYNQQQWIKSQLPSATPTTSS